MKSIFIDTMWEIFFIDNIKLPNVESVFINIMLDYLLIILNEVMWEIFLLIIFYKLMWGRYYLMT